jgi:hypothetical protein
MTGGDQPTAQLFRVPLERLLDNTAFLQKTAVATALRQMLALRANGFALAETDPNFGMATLLGVEGAAPPAILYASGDLPVAVYEDQDAENYNSGTFSAIPDLTSVIDAAVAPSGLTVVVGGGSPYHATRAINTDWSAGSAFASNTMTRVAYSPDAARFLATQVSGGNVYRSADGLSWSTVASGLSDARDVSGITASGIVVVMNQSTSPGFAVSDDGGASYSAAAGTVPYEADADAVGSMTGCPAVTRGGLGSYVYHAAICDGGDNIRTSRSADGDTWEPLTVIPKPSLGDFGSALRMYQCQTTGIAVIVVGAVHPLADDGHNTTYMYASIDMVNWFGPVCRDGDSVIRYGIAGGVFAKKLGTAFSVGSAFPQELLI